MSEPEGEKDKLRRKAQNHFTQTEQRDKLVKQEIEKERQAIDAKTAKLRALRLAKEAAEKEEADRLAALRRERGEPEPSTKRRKKTTKVATKV